MRCFDNWRSLCVGLTLLAAMLPPLLHESCTSAQNNAQYPFQNPDLSADQRIDNLLLLMTLDEKIACLSTNPSVPRLGVKASGHVEGIHGLTQGGPGHWGRPKTIPTTTFPQGIGLGEKWDPDLLRQVAE